jgi:hypothetical protein
MKELTPENLFDFISNYPTKHKQGFLPIETNEILKRFNIDKKLFYEKLGVNTCMVIEEQTVNFKSDIELALRCVLENRDKKIGEWD